nr:putative ribonuclease H-like domain-containing protein [Tanacetum cinerariifolium]
MYNVNLRNIVLSWDLTCLFAKATLDEYNLWHRRLGHVNFKTINKLVKGNLVRGLPTKVLTNDNSCVACKKGKQHRASCKSKTVSSGDQPLFRLHMDLFGPTFVKILSKKSYCLVITSRFSWVFFLASKAETTPVLKTFIVGLENLLSLKETLHVNFMENKPNVAGSGPAWLFDIDSLTRTMNYHPVIAENQTNSHADALVDGNEHDDDIQKSVSPDIHSSSSSAQTRRQCDKTKNKDKVNAASSSVSTAGHNFINSTNDFSAAGPSNAAASPTATNSLKMPNLEDLTYSDDADDVGAEADINNLESIISTRSMARTIRDQGRISQ